MHWTIGLTALAHFQAAFVYAQSGSKGRPPKYACPADDGLQYTTPEPNVVTFELKCGQGTTAKRIDNTPKDSQKECAIHCSEHPECQSADYNAATKNCARFSEYIPTIPMAGVNTWFPIEERKTKDAKPDPQPLRTDQCPPTTRAISESRSDSSTFTSDSSCPEDEGKIFVSASGVYMKIRCTGHVSSTQLAIQPLGSLTECYNYCADTPGCKSVFWEAGYPGWNCRLYPEQSEDKFVECKTPTHGTAFVIDPPTIESPDDPIVLCSTECPMAHGQVYDSPSGERFKMNCCARHGVTVLGTEPMPSLKACMDACGKMPSCQSVDWHQTTGTCYFGKHSGDPAISVAGWAAAYSIGCAGACSPKGGCCGSIDSAPVSEPSSQVPMTPDGPLPPPAQCGNQGLRWAEYHNAQGSCSDSTYSQFRPEVYKTVTPGSSGVTSSVGGIDALGGQQITVYGGTKTFAGDYFALDHTGYLYASVGGKHTISIDSVDDVLMLWVGAKALKGWTRSNADLFVPLSQGGSYEVDIPAGHYMPIRVMFVQGQGRAKFGMKIQGPDGQVIADSSTPSSPWIVQYSCDRVAAPEFPKWGSEE